LKKGAVVQDRHEALHRQVQSLLNKIAPDNLQVICFKLADIQISNAEELQFVIEIIFKKALSESHYCSTYADMMTVLGHCYPEFPAETEGGSPRSFTRMLLTTVQSEYESFPKTLEPTPEMVASAASSEDLATLVLQVKKKMLANMKLMGHLFLRKLISLKIVQSTVSALLAPVGAHDPEEHLVECVIEIMTCVGFTLEESAAEGQQFLRLTTERLRVLRANKSYSTRCRLLILDYLDLVEAKWKKKVYTEGAKKVSEVHKAARRNAFNKQAFSFEIAGAAPANLTELENLKPVPKAKPKPKSAPKPPGDGPKPCFGVDLCRSFLLGRCNRGTKCRFIHDQEAKDAQAADAAGDAAGDAVGDQSPGQPAPAEAEEQATPAKSSVQDVAAALFGDSDDSDEIIEVTVDLHENQPFDDSQLVRLLGYYAEDHDDEALVIDFEGLGLGDQARSEAVRHLLERGFSEPPAKAKTIAKVLGVLVRQGALTAQAIYHPLRGCLDELEDWIIDNPQARDFYTALAHAALEDRATARWAFAPLIGHPNSAMLTRNMSADCLRALHAAGQHR